MAQQLQQPQTGMGQQAQYGQPGGQQAQYGQPSMGAYAQPSLGAGQFAGQFPTAAAAGRQLGQRYDQSVPSDVRAAVEDLDRVSSVAEWTKTRAAQRGMPRVVRICDDLEDIAHLEKKLIIRQSPFAGPIGQASTQVIQQGLQELQQHVSEPEVQEVIANVQRSLDSINRGLTTLQQVGQQQQAGPMQQPGAQYQPQAGQGTTQQFGQPSASSQF